MIFIQRFLHRNLPNIFATTPIFGMFILGVAVPKEETTFANMMSTCKATNWLYIVKKHFAFESRMFILDVAVPKEGITFTYLINTYKIRS